MTAILCLDLGRACACCGGWVGDDPIPSPRGKALRYCSTECFDDWEEHLDQQDRARSAAWCPTCGYDRHEHAPDCADWLAHQQERRDHPVLYEHADA